jgi:hypothetical protein
MQPKHGIRADEIIIQLGVSQQWPVFQTASRIELSLQ